LFHSKILSRQEPKRFAVDLLQHLNSETQYLYSLLSLSHNGAAPPSGRLVNAEMALEGLANVIKHNRGKRACLW
jgi:hypothetical protein